MIFTLFQFRYTMQKALSFSLTLLLLTLFPFAGNAVTKTWVSTSNTSWSTAANWSPSGIPATTDDVVFNSGSVNCVMPTTGVALLSLTINGTYTGTISRTTGILNLTSATTAFSMSTGTFTAGSADITITGSSTLSGGTINCGFGDFIFNGPFTQSGGTLNGNTTTTTFHRLNCNSTFLMSGGTMNLGKTVINVGGNMTFNSSALTFNAGTSSSVLLTKSCTLSVSNEPVLSFYRFGFNNFNTASGTFVILDNSGASSIEVTNELYYGSTSNITVNSGKLKVLGNLIIANENSASTINPGTTIIEFSGAGNQVFSGSTAEFRCLLSPVVINKSGGNLELRNIISLGAGLTRTANAAVTVTYDNTSVLCFNNTQTISITDPVRDVQFNLGTYTFSTPLNVKGNFLTRGSAGNVTLNGTLNCEGEVRAGNAFITTNAGTGKIVLMGTGNQALIGQGVAGTGRLCDIEINKPSGIVSLQSTISVMGNWTVISGTIDPGASSVWFYQRTATTTNIDMLNSASVVQAFDNLGIGSGTLNLTTAITVAENFTINTPAATTLLANGNAITIAGDWTNNGTFTPGAAGQTITFNGTTPSTINTSAASQTFNNLTINKSSVMAVTLNKPVTVNTTLTLTQGYIATTSTNLLSLPAAGTISGGSNTAFVSGPMSKVTSGNFTFPLGSPATGTGNYYHPLDINPPTPAGSNTFVAEYISAPQALGSNKVAALLWLSDCDYWTIQRTAGTGTVKATLNWEGNCPAPSMSNLRVAAWNGTQWTNLGITGSAAGSTSQGSLQSNSTITFSGTTAVPLALASTVAVSSPSDFTYIQLQQDPDGSVYYTNGDVLYFQYEEEYEDQNGFLNYRIINLATNATQNLLSGPSTTNVPVAYGTNFYQMQLLTAVSTPLVSGYYLLEVTNDKNEVFRARFFKN